MLKIRLEYLTIYTISQMVSYMICEITKMWIIWSTIKAMGF